MEETKINKLSQYVEYVEELSGEFTVSRGHSKESYKLLPSALRLDEDGNRKYSRQLTAHFLEMFKMNSHNYLQFPWDVNNDLEWMVMAQHYGLPTRLLDFTDSHIISLMFAVENSFLIEGNEDAEVWFLNPVELNNLNSRMSKIININETSIATLDTYNGPVAVQSRKMNVRINAQSGMFVYFQDVVEELDKGNVDEKVLRKVLIDANARKDILASLYSMGIGKTQIYPELSSVATDILVRDNIREYMKGME